MSQNTHTLHLFFQDRLRLRQAQLVYQYLVQGNDEEARRWAQEWDGADVENLWDADWFNAGVQATADCLALTFDTGKHDALPLAALQDLLARGVKAAVLDTFYDQVGETQRMYFMDGQWVPRIAFKAAHLAWAVQAEGTGAADTPEDEEERASEARDPRKPMAVSVLRAQEEQREREGRQAAEEMVGLIRDLSANGGGAQGVMSGLRAIVLLRAGFKGLMHAVAFTVIALVCFKGFWIWLGLGVVLALLLPVAYMVFEYRDLKGPATE